MRVVYFVIKFIKYNDLFFPSLSRIVNPASRLEGDATLLVSEVGSDRLGQWDQLDPWDPLGPRDKLGQWNPL